MHCLLDLVSQILYFVFWGIDDATYCCTVHHLPLPFQMVHITCMWEEQRDQHTGHSGGTLCEVHGPGGGVNIFWIHLRFCHRVLWQWLWHWLEYNYVQNTAIWLVNCWALFIIVPCIFIAPMGYWGTACFLCNTADYRPFYTYYVAMSSHGHSSHS